LHVFAFFLYLLYEKQMNMIKIPRISILPRL